MISKAGLWWSPSELGMGERGRDLADGDSECAFEPDRVGVESMD
jgi:hypothetical protein